MAHYLVNVDGREFDIEVEYRQHGYEVKVNGKETVVQGFILGETRRQLLIDNHSHEVDVRGNGIGSQRIVFMHGREIPLEIEDFNLAQLRKTAGLSSGVAVEAVLKAPMPGLVLELKVAPGDRVRKGQPLIIIEAMKMENVIKAQADVVIKATPAEPGDSVEKGDPLVEFEV